MLPMREITVFWIVQSWGMPPSLSQCGSHLVIRYLRQQGIEGTMIFLNCLSLSQRGSHLIILYLSQQGKPIIVNLIHRHHVFKYQPSCLGI